VGTEVCEALNGGVELVGSDVEVHAVLGRLWFRACWRTSSGPGALFGDENDVWFDGVCLLVADGSAPELGGTIRVLAVEDDHERHRVDSGALATFTQPPGGRNGSPWEGEAMPRKSPYPYVVELSRE
jgi:hypothetical protein